MSTYILESCVGRSAHSIHFSDPQRFINYRDRCLKLFGQEYDGLGGKIYDSWNPFRLSTVKDNITKGSQAGNTANLKKL